ncbi:SDR family NAD(P)-dependent oxidoreductase [Streptococcus hongkongensis]|nr:short-chain dehydrogenase [Streptococcus uberis]
MANRKIVITGASGGLAEAIINLLPSDDFLILLGRDKEKLEQMYQNRANKVTIALDISDSQAIEQVVEAVSQEYGTIDVLINNAGYGAFKRYDQFESHEVEAMFKVNTFASMHFARLFGQQMAARGSGHIINIISIAGLVSTSKSSVYSATKFAMIGFTNALRLELADSGVLVTSINPGPIKTKFFDIADPDGNYLESVHKVALEADQVAQKIVASIGKNKRDINMPLLLALTAKWYALFPKFSDYLARKVFNFK